MANEFRESAIEYHEADPPGKLAITPTKPLATQRDLSLAYSPGVAFACEAIINDNAATARLTARAHPGGKNFGEPLASFQHIRGGGEALPGQQGSQKTIHGCLSGMERLAHSAKYLFNPRSLSPGDPESINGLRRGQPEQIGASGRCPEMPQSPGGMPAAKIVFRVYDGRNSALRLEPGNESGDKIFPRRPLPFSQCQYGREDRGRGMSHHP